MYMTELNNLLHFLKTIFAVSVVIITLYMPCGAEQLDISGDLSGDRSLSPALSRSMENLSPLERRKLEEDQLYGRPFVLIPHRQNYFLVIDYKSDPNAGILNNPGLVDLKNYEAKFQISFKFRVWKNMFGENGDMFFAYTQRSVWQLYDEALSSPFRDTNYEPEVFLKFDTDFNVAGLNNRVFMIGFNHQSNGESEPLSRSWNRIYSTFIAERGNLVLILKPWYRIPEKEENDDNPNMEKYMGYGELIAAYQMDKHIFSLMLRNNLRVNDVNRGALELGWSYPVTPKVRAYVQFFNGYGESLIDYDNSLNRIGFGVMLNDWI